MQIERAKMLTNFKKSCVRPSIVNILQRISRERSNMINIKILAIIQKSIHKYFSISFS